MNRTKFVIVLLTSAVFGSTALAFSFARTGMESAADRDRVPAVTLSTDEVDLEVEVITARANGFEPTTITRPRGPFWLGIQNKSGSGELVLRLSRTQGGQVHEMRMMPGRRRHHQRLDLPPGDYLLSEADHPAWTCQLVISR